MARFKLDENLPAAATDFLRTAGHDVLTVRDQGLVGRPDEEIHAVCKSEQRVLVTLDRGFGDPRRHGTGGTPGIIVLRPPSQDREHVLALMRALPAALAQHAIQGALWIVEPHRIRIRRA